MQAHRDLTVLLGAFFLATLAAAFVVASVVSGLGWSVDHVPTLLAIASGGTAAFLALLVAVAALDLRHRRRIDQDAAQLDLALRHLQRQHGAAEADEATRS